MTIRQIDARLIRLLTRRPLPHRTHDVPQWSEQVIAHEPNPVLQGLIFNKQPTGTGVSDMPLGWLGEDPIGNGVTDEAAEVKDGERKVVV
jgi:hypothetical protein